MPEPKRPLKVFLSYASQDKLLVRELSRRLVGEGWIDTWQDEKNLLPGQDWRVKIEEAVEDADVVIIVLSQHSVSKEGHVQKELRYAREIALEKPEDAIFLIPLRLDECEVPRGLRFYQWVDYFGDNKDSSYEALAASLKLRYEQKIKSEEAERLRKELQEREREAADKLAREKAEKEAAENARLEVEELGRQKVAKEKAEREAAERAERQRREKEEREKQAREVSEKARREREERQAARKTDAVKALNKITATLKSTFAQAKPFLRVAGIISIVFVFLWLGSLAIPKFIGLIPTTNASVVPSTNTNVSATKTLRPDAVPTKTRNPVSTSLPTEITDAKGVSMALVPEGEFIMGIDSYLNKVNIDSYYIDKYEVTNSEYKKCVSAQQCSPPADTTLSSLSYYGNSTYDLYPVVWVTKEYAEQYCDWRGARLPSEAEWEKAARGTDQRYYPWGNQTNLALRANGPGSEDGFELTAPVGSFPLGVSPYGVFDMAGNVSEFIADNYEDQSTGRSYPLSKGGDWYSDPRGVGSWLLSYLSHINYHQPDGWLGFRCVKDVTP
jgi:formylglycine-generating enzyme required for sulfatase activity